MIRKGARHAARLVGLVAVAGLAACGGGNGSSDIIEAEVSAADGGSFTDSSGTVTVVVPQGALAADAVLRVGNAIVATGADDPEFASAAFEVSLKRANGDDVALDRPIKVVLRADQTPEHPTLGELSRFDAGQWQRVDASFYRASSQSVVGLSRRNRATYRVTLRTLQATQGDAVARGRTVLMEETFGNEAFFGDVIGLHTLLDNVSPADAVALGVQVDINRLPQSVIDLMTGSDLAAKDAALGDPATTRAPSLGSEPRSKSSEPCFSPPTLRFSPPRVVSTYSLMNTPSRRSCSFRSRGLSASTTPVVCFPLEFRPL